MYIPKSLQQPRHTYACGHYFLSPAELTNSALKNWIESLAFAHLENEQHRLHRYSRKRNRLYLLDLPFLPAKVVMKVSSISSGYRFWRRLNLMVTGWFKDYNLNAFYASLGYEANGIDSLQCIAQWTYRPIQGSKKSYLLYYYVDASMTLAELVQTLNLQRGPLIDSIGTKIGAILRNIHAAGMRHGDPHTGNFLVPLHSHETQTLTPDKLASLKFTLVDLDKSEFARRTHPLIKRFFDLRCLRRFRIGDRSGIDLIAFYAPNAHDPYTMKIVQFWQQGGFNLYKRLHRNKTH